MPDEGRAPTPTRGQFAVRRSVPPGPSRPGGHPSRPIISLDFGPKRMPEVVLKHWSVETIRKSRLNPTPKSIKSVVPAGDSLRAMVDP